MVSISDIEDQVRRERLMVRRYWTKLPTRWMIGLLLYAFATALPIVCPDWWIADLIANLRVQVLLIGIPFLASVMLYQAWKPLLLLTTLLAYHISWFLLIPAVSTADSSVPSALTVMAANVYTGNRNFEEVERQFRDSKADLIVVSELSHELAEHLEQSFTTDYPFHQQFPADRGNFGMGCYSKIPFQESSMEFLTDDSVPTSLVKLDVSGRQIQIIGVHTLPPMSPEMFRHRNRHLSMISERMRLERAKNPDLSFVVLGDFNLTPWSKCFHRFQADSELRLATSGPPIRPTWYRWPIFPFGLVLDHVMLSEDLQCVSRTLGPPAGSDHRFVTVSLGLNGNQKKK